MIGNFVHIVQHKHFKLLFNSTINLLFVFRGVAHHHIKLMCMAKPTHQLLNVMFLAIQEQLMLASHGGAGQSVQKGEKKFCLETMMSLWDVNFNFVTVPAGLVQFQGFPGNHAQERNER